ncbi:MAG: hypothetical protein KDK37_06440, partial [Leptospiraceae bacterium]|nr:hypothetical protein [Leptospiraceae bacterium]
IIAELGFLYRIATNWQFMVSINARKERFQVNGSYYYATTPPTSSIEPLLPFLYAQAPHIPEFTEQSYAVALGLRLYIW